MTRGIMEQAGAGICTQVNTSTCSVQPSSDVTHTGLQRSVWPNGLVVSALGIRTPGSPFDSRVAPLLHWVATLGKLFTHVASPVSELQEIRAQKGVFGA